MVEVDFLTESRAKTLTSISLDSAMKEKSIENPPEASSFLILSQSQTTILNLSPIFQTRTPTMLRCYSKEHNPYTFAQTTTRTTYNNAASHETTQPNLRFSLHNNHPSLSSISRK
jgi:hypothetical protein